MSDWITIGTVDSGNPRQCLTHLFFHKIPPHVFSLLRYGAPLSYHHSTRVVSGQGAFLLTQLQSLNQSGDEVTLDWPAITIVN